MSSRPYDTDSCPFIIITAFGTVEDAVHAMKIGASDFLQKPVPPDDLVRIVYATISGKYGPTGTEGMLASPVSDLRVHLALEVVDARYGDPELSLRSVASHVGISSYFLARLFKRETGRSFLFFVHRRRISEAARLLLTTTLSVKEIAAQVGYSSTSWLDHNFNRFHGIKPTEYRRRRR